MPQGHNAAPRPLHTDGYAMAALLVGMAIMAVFMSMALPAWRTAAQREKEAELIFRGQQYARAIVLFQRKFANTFPPNVQVLLDGHFLRKKYKDPITGGDFQPVYASQQAAAQPSVGGIVPTQGQPVVPTTTVGGGTSIGAQGGIIGVASKSEATALRIYNGQTQYNKWVFLAQQVSGRIGAPNGSQTPTGGINLPGGLPGGRGGLGVPGPDGRITFPPGQGPGPFGPRGGGQGTPFGTPFGPGGFDGGQGRGR